METIKLFYDDSFMQEFDAEVLSCTENGKGFCVILNQTAFYPEGGGQPADMGTLGCSNVVDVHEKDGVILHTCSSPLTPGETVHGVIDWTRRFDHMQQHSGEHIVSGMICERFHCDNVGFHMGNDIVTIDYNTEIAWEDLLEIEAKANQYIWENHDFVAIWPSKEELALLPYRSKKELEGPVRITSFPGADMCACCGTHVKQSGQVGLVKFLSCQKFRDGVRIELLSGKRAIDYLSRCWEQSRDLGQQLSVKPTAIVGAVEKIRDELTTIKNKADHLEELHFKGIADKYKDAGDVLLVCEDMTSDATRRLCDLISSVCMGRCAVFSGTDGSYKYAVIHLDHDISGFIKSMNQALTGRGGGRNGFAQGSVQATREQIESFFS